MDRRLYDIILRHQMYLDAYKNYQISLWRKQNPLMIKAMKEAIRNEDYDSLGDLNKKESNKLKRDLSNALAAILMNWQNHLFDEMKDFCKAEMPFQKSIIASYLSDNEVTDNDECNKIIDDNKTDDYKAGLIPYSWLQDNDNSKTHVAILQALMGASGSNAQDFINSLTEKATARLQNEINKAIANNETLKELENDIIGTSENGFKDGILISIDREARNITETVIQNFSITIETAYTSTAFDRYMWIAVLDSSTCPSCIFLDHQIFYNGAGPSVPYHRKCRCSEVPYNGSDLPEENSISQWTLQQPNSVQTDLAKSTSLNLNEYTSKLTNILTRE